MSNKKKQLGNKNSHKNRSNRQSVKDYLPYSAPELSKEKIAERKTLFKKVKELAIIISQENNKDKLAMLWNEKRLVMSKLEVYNY